MRDTRSTPSNLPSAGHRHGQTSGTASGDSGLSPLSPQAVPLLLKPRDATSVASTSCGGCSSPGTPGPYAVRMLTARISRDPASAPHAR